MTRRSHPGHGALRRGRVSIQGQVYCLTTATTGRAPIFRELHAARAVIRTLRELHLQGSITSLAFVLMPDHLHWLVELRSESLAKIMQRMKSSSARGVNQLRGGTSAVWQPGFHDRAVRAEEDIRTVADYLVSNPLRAGLANAIGDYPHWDCRWL